MGTTKSTATRSGSTKKRSAGSKASSDGANRPAHEVRFGSIKAVIWANETENGTRYATRIVKLYRDGEEWKETTSFNRDDLLLVAKVSDHAHTWIFEASGSTS